MGRSFCLGYMRTASLLRVVGCDVKELDIGLIMIRLRLSTVYTNSVDQTQTPSAVYQSCTSCRYLKSSEHLETQTPAKPSMFRTVS